MYNVHGYNVGGKWAADPAAQNLRSKCWKQLRCVRFSRALEPPLTVQSEGTIYCLKVGIFKQFQGSRCDIAYVGKRYLKDHINNDYSLNEIIS